MERDQQVSQHVLYLTVYILVAPNILKGLIIDFLLFIRILSFLLQIQEVGSSLVLAEIG